MSLTSYPRLVYDCRGRLDTSILYQRYYLQGLERIGEVRMGAGPSFLQKLVPPSERARLFSVAADLAGSSFLGRLFPGPARHFAGCYRFEQGSERRRFVIDAHDAPDIMDPEECGKADIYFKSNYWGARAYPPNVRSIVNGNGILGRREIEHLRSLRQVPKTLDMVFISRVWGGIDHNVRLMEVLSELKGETRIVAMFSPDTLHDAHVRDCQARLRERGIECRTQTLAPRELWSLLASSRLVFLRPGKHLCIPWRMIDLLAMGSCIVMDSDPRPAWPVPLERGKHYESCGLRRPPNTDMAPEGDYGRIVPAVEALLGDPDRMKDLSQASGDYFDTHASPERVADYIVRVLSGINRELP